MPGQENTPGEKPMAKRKLSRGRRNKLVAWGTVAAVIIVCAFGFWSWHNTPGFCANPVCHDAMDPYLDSYMGKSGTWSVDKWDNDVQNSYAMLAVVHRDEELGCLDCHVPSLDEQLGEVSTMLSGSYADPLKERSVFELMQHAHIYSDSGLGDEFCMNEACHDMDRLGLQVATKNLKFNPHDTHHGETACSECHKSHRASVLTCTECHSDARNIMPEGWLTYSEAKELSK